MGNSRLQSMHMDAFETLSEYYIIYMRVEQSKVKMYTVQEEHKETNQNGEKIKNTTTTGE